MNDILVGASDTLNQSQLVPWFKSARESGFTGDIWLIVYRRGVIWDDKFFEDNGVNLYPVVHDPYGNAIHHEQRGSPTQAHSMRFFHAWELLTRLDRKQIKHCIMTDARDVIFQANPTEWLSTQLPKNHALFVAGSEGIAYNKEEWNQDNLINGYGRIMWELEAQRWSAYNVGTMGGDVEVMRDLFNTIFRMTEGRCYYPSDQSSLAVLVHGAFQHCFMPGYLRTGWAAPLGTTQDPTKQWLWARCNEVSTNRAGTGGFERPTITEEGLVLTGKENTLSDGPVPYVCVHQWDRVPKLKAIIEKKYGI